MHGAEQAGEAARAVAGPASQEKGAWRACTGGAKRGAARGAEAHQGLGLLLRDVHFCVPYSLDVLQHPAVGFCAAPGRGGQSVLSLLCATPSSRLREAAREPPSRGALAQSVNIQESAGVNSPTCRFTDARWSSPYERACSRASWNVYPVPLPRAPSAAERMSVSSAALSWRGTPSPTRAGVMRLGHSFGNAQASGPPLVSRIDHAGKRSCLYRNPSYCYAFHRP